MGFKYIGQLILQGTIALGGEESAGLSILGTCRKKTASWHVYWWRK